MILNDVFQFLHDTGLVRNHAIFSRDYLGHSARYYDYLRCSGASPSLHSMIKLIGCLQRLARNPEAPVDVVRQAESFSREAMTWIFQRCE